MTKYFINALGLALIAAGESMINSAAAMPEPIEGMIITGDGSGTPAPLIGTVELDSEGLPHDPRLHASTKNKTQAGTWTKLKGVDDTTRAAVTAELRVKYPAPQAALPAAPATPATPTIPVVAMPAAPMTPYTELCNWLAANTGEGKPLTAEWVQASFASNNIALADLANNNDASKQWLDAFKGVLAGMQK